MRVDLHCPVELLSVDFARDDHGNTRAYLHLVNLSDQRISAIALACQWLDAQGQSLAQTCASLNSLNAGAHAQFSAQITLPQSAAPRAIELVYTRIAFEAGRDDWLGASERLCDVPVLPTPDGRELNRLCAAAGADAVNFPLRTGQLWLCVCGHANPSRSKHCRRCGRERAHVLSAYSMAALLQAAPPCAPHAPVDIPLMQPRAPVRSGSSAARDPGAAARAQCHRQLNHLIRRTITLLLLALLLAFAAWASAHRPPRNQPIPPVKIEAGGGGGERGGGGNRAAG
ncbi:MAG: FxLYD domain-containing protein, partial [Clostridia bacterium]